MKKDNERKQLVSAIEGTKITRVKIVDGGKAIEVYSIPCESNNYLDEMFPIVKASTLSLDDEFLYHEPQSKAQARLKESLIAEIKSGLKDFRRPIMDPSFDDNGNIVYEKGRKPAVGKSAKWWDEELKQFMPEKNSRQGNRKLEYDPFLGLLIKYLIEEKKYSKEEAWKAVCEQSKDLGHYWDSKNAKHELEPTGSRKIGEWYDLANTCKYVEDEEKASGFSLVGGDYYNCGDYYPLADVFSVDFPNSYYDYGVGWLVLDV